VRLSRGWLKLRRDILASRWQFLAVAAVIALGVAIFIGSYSSYQNLRSSYDRTYDELHMADLWFEVDDAPAAVVQQVRDVDGVAAAEGRLVEELPVVLPKAGQERILGRFVTLPPPAAGRATVNDVKVTRGEYFTPGSDMPQVLLEKSFAEYHDAKPGDTLQLIVAEGKTIDLRVVGVAASPEYLWVAKSERELFTLPSTFGIMFVPYDQLSAELGRPDRINEVALRLNGGADEGAVRTEVTSLLKPYNLGRVVDRQHQLGNRLLHLDLDGFEALALVFPILFLSVSALAIYTLLNRLVQTQRPHIGLMRAIGYSRGQVMEHYLVYGLIIGVVAAAAGVGLGYVLSVLITAAYGHYLNVPFISQRLQPGVMAIGFGAGVLTSLVAGAIPAWGSARTRPAEAMHPPPPAAGRRTILEIIVPPLAHVSYLLRLPLRNLFRAQRRTLYTALGVGSGVALVLVAASFLDSYDSMIKLQFDDIQKYDAWVGFTQPAPQSLADQVAGYDGVARAEPLLEVPVTLSADGRSHITVLRGIEAGSRLYGTPKHGGGTASIGTGLLLTSGVSKLLDVGVGDTVTAQPLLPGGRATELAVDAIVDNPMGDVALSRLDTAQGLVGTKGLASALLVSFTGSPDEALQQRLLALPGTPTVEYTKDVQDYIHQLNQLFFVFVGIMLAFGVALGFAIIFNTITINTLERRRELATMRTIGSAVGRLGAMLTVENVLMGILGVVVGLPLGYVISLYFASLYQNELFDMPTVIYARTYGIAALGALLVLLLAEIPSILFVRRLDLPAVVREMSA
jgi:putative ABC transport system permease protein